MTMAPIRPPNPADAGSNAVIAPATLGYWWGVLATDYPDRLDETLNAVAHEATARFVAEMETAMQAVGVSRADPEERKRIYMLKPLAMWEEQRQKFPDDYDRDRTDYLRLLGRRPQNVRAGELALVAGAPYIGRPQPAPVAAAAPGAPSLGRAQTMPVQVEA